MEAKNKKYLLYAGIVVVAIIVWVAFIQPMLKQAKDDKQDKDAGDEILENSQIISQGGTPTSFNPRPYTDQIWDDINAYFPTPRIYKELNGIASDENLRAIWQDWRNRYKSQYKNRELRAAINAAYWAHASWDPDWTGGAGLISNRLKSIGLP